MPFDAAAVERLAAEVSRTFAAGLREIAAAADKEADLERQRLAEEARLLARDRARLEEAWSQLHVERMRLECSTGASTGLNSLQTPRRSLSQSAPRPVVLSPGAGHSALASEGQGIGGSAASIGAPRPEALVASFSPTLLSSIGASPASPKVDLKFGQVPVDCVVNLHGHSYAVLPLQSPEAETLGHEMWNQTMELPENWEILSSTSDGFNQAIAALTQRRWGAIVLGVRNVRQGFDAYWTPLFGDGTHQGQKCEEDVDWIEPVADNPRRFRMTYSGLRIVIRLQRTTTVVRPLHGLMN